MKTKMENSQHGEAPLLRFGVVADMHITTPASCAMTEKAFRYFKARGADAIMVPGDMTDWGLRSGLEYYKTTWDRVFAGTNVVPLFCTGNHEYDGWWYGDMTMDMHANGYSEDEALSKLGLESEWERVFGEKFESIRLRTVKGYSFISGEEHGYRELGEWLAVHGASLADDRPFFYFQHEAIGGTTSDAPREPDEVFTALKDFPNAVAFTGHTHRPFYDERLIWQGEFTVMAAPSISYNSPEGNYENGAGPRNGTSKQAMPEITTRLDLRGGQVFFVSVHADRIIVERIDIEEGCVAGAPPWVLPLVGGERPYAIEARAAKSVAPEFPSGATLEVETRNTNSRSGRWIIVMNCEFPSAMPAEGERVFDYEIRAVPKDGSEPLVKRFLPPSYAKMAKYEPVRQRFWFDVAEVPQDKEYVLEVRARNCFGKASRPLVSGVWRSEPGLGTPRR